ncbi:MAG TPA: hypothetical protein VJ302_24820, partial [Blastocatellia bacterium]|nr:hypothetical protein [Blastocatellia bacterium]
MDSVFICLFALIITYIAGRRSLVTGLGVLLTFGYAYGIVRANLQESGAHFIFDAAVAGLFLAQLPNYWNPAEKRRTKQLRRWLFFLIGWPVLLFFIPIQDPLVELVGLRGNIFFLPFLLLGARLSEDDLYRLALWLSVLNIGAFGFAVAEYFLGIEMFFPYREGVTTLIYMSGDVTEMRAFRIPATFSNAHAYAGVMVATIPFIAGAWVQKHDRLLYSYLFPLALVASAIGVFMAAARTPVIFLFVLLTIITLSRKVKILARVGWVVLLVGVAWLVSNEQRMQRFITLQDTGFVVQRFGWSMNQNFNDLIVRYPMGNGLGGGGTSLPYFLQNRVKNLPLMENEYARLLLEQGVPGLCLWITFLIWVFFRRPATGRSNWS